MRELNKYCYDGAMRGFDCFTDTAVLDTIGSTCFCDSRCRFGYRCRRPRPREVAVLYHRPLPGGKKPSELTSYGKTCCRIFRLLHPHPRHRHSHPRRCQRQGMCPIECHEGRKTCGNTSHLHRRTCNRGGNQGRRTACSPPRRTNQRPPPSIPGRRDHCCRTASIGTPLCHRGRRWWRHW